MPFIFLNKPPELVKAIEKLKNSGYIPKRGIDLTFVPDEEIGGADGMGIML